MEIRGDLDLRRYLYITCQSSESDSVGDIRLYSISDKPVYEKCIEEAPVKGEGIWEEIEYVNVNDVEELLTEELPTEELPTLQIIFESEENSSGNTPIVITETSTPTAVTYTWSLDESAIDHNTLFNWEADRHREMNYEAALKVYLIND